MSSLKGKTVLVTGAGQGIGREIVKELSNLGVNVIGVSRSAGPLNELKDELKGKSFQGIQLDLADWKKTRETLGNLNVKLDGIVNNAGIAVLKDFEALTEDEYDQVMCVNLKACFNVLQTLSSKLNEGASIVNISSLAGLRACQGHTVYGASKAGLDALTKNLAFEWGHRQIRVNSVNPTVILTRMGRDNWTDPAKAEPLLMKIPMRRFGEVKEVVDPVIYLLSDQSSFISGTLLPIEGGFQA